MACAGSGIVIDSENENVLNSALAVLERALDEVERIYVGYSGGLDSHVLLHLACSLPGKPEVTALHINHQLSPHAQHWQEHCQRVCADLGVPCEVEKVTVPDRGFGPEGGARRARYQVFDRKVGAGEILLLGHHADDQVETVLYRLLRGSGVKGLAGIPLERPLLHGIVLRPLLGVSQTVLQDYAREYGLQWVEDESNQRIDYDRNYLRHQVIPKLLARWSDLGASVALSARHSSDSDRLNADLARLDLAQLDLRAERLGSSLSIDHLLALPEYRQRNVLRHWIPDDGRTKAWPGHRILETVFTQVIGARQDARPVVRWSNLEWRRFRTRLYCLPAGWQREDNKAPVSERQLWQIDRGCQQNSFSLPGGGQLQADRQTGKGLFIAEGEVVSIGFRRGGERCRPAGRGASSNLKKLFQQYHLEPWWRAEVPLVFLNDRLAAVGDLWICEGFQVSGNASGYQFTWVLDRQIL